MPTHIPQNASRVLNPFHFLPTLSLQLIPNSINHCSIQVPTKNAHSDRLISLNTNSNSNQLAAMQFLNSCQAPKFSQISIAKPVPSSSNAQFIPNSTLAQTDVSPMSTQSRRLLSTFITSIKASNFVTQRAPSMTQASSSKIS